MRAHYTHDTVLFIGTNIRKNDDKINLKIHFAGFEKHSRNANVFIS